ncbi:GNAT family N-acetyltransferase [Jannaschia pohangensis]|uniref:Acetyltransferase (GNAT) domain-containing protein n=1 Tax=Jannaschia pohangensis TaxID=390807 RepID=A0A1I3JCM2_9RHOB|nr:GNAT family N-acetyltransferase [Jannaschia pohangensis]SFI57964.1 Acetyltransferase (GNAT) domain-containing protein [Jannaschia pohangensis]
MILRRATSDDAPACAAIVADWLRATDWMPDAPTRDQLEAIMRDGFPRREVWVAATEDDAILGYLSFAFDENHIYGLYVATPGQGVGRALLDRVKADRDRITLRSHAPNTAAHRFYEREGFRVVERGLTGADGVPEILMEWRR